MGAAEVATRLRAWLKPDRHDPTQVVLRRIVANVLDALLIAGIILVVIYITGDVKRASSCPDPIPKGRSCIGYNDQALIVNDRVFFWFFFTLITMFFLVFVVCQSITGTSPGKAVLHIRVVRPDGTKPGWKRSFLRAVCWGVDGLLLLLPTALWLAMFTPRHRRVGDYVAQTYVVKRDAAGRPVPRRRQLVASGSPSPAPVTAAGE